MNEGESVYDFCWCPYMSALDASIISRPFAMAYLLSVKFPRCRQGRWRGGRCGGGGELRERR